MDVATKQQEEAFTPIPLEQLDFYWLQNGLVPVFTANIPDVCKHIEAHGFQIYYVIATEKYSVKVSDTYSKVEERPQIFKVMTSIIGRSVVPAAEDIFLDKLQADAWLALPKIPYHLVMMMDDFFRLIEDELGTESIVLLTYDSTKTGPEGWGVLVPDQNNTSMDCDYKADSVVDEKPDHVYIVGSAHSHPGMDAYASGTDHKDQANFDGLHITFGWKKSKNNGQTEYHIELQTGGKSFTFNAEQVFESFPAREPTEDVKEWAKKVQKKAWTNPGQKSGGSTSTGSVSGTTNPNIHKNIKLPTGCPDIKSNIVIAEVYDSDTECPFCDTLMISVDRDKRRCMSCHQYLCLEGDTLVTMIEARLKAGVYTVDIDVPSGTAEDPIYIWRRPNGITRFDQVFEGK